MKTRAFFKPMLWIGLLLVLFGAACGGESADEGANAPAEPTATQESALPEATPTEESSGAASSVTEVQQAVIQIEFLGSYRDPAVGPVSGSGYGSGFIIDPSGIAVTNNHVVAGAASLKVRIGGDTTKTYNARVLGVSECSDLAVIDIEGDGFAYLEWYTDQPAVGMDVYAAGFPLGEPEYTLTRGVVSKANTSGETAWASVDGVIGHDATINPGNSGGPLVNQDGQVVGINYRARPDYAQFFAISAAEAIPIVEQLRQGTDIDSIGVNGQAVVSNDGSLSGIWVSSVVSGSPADKAGLQEGDVIVKMEGIPLATDGTMSDYCDVLRSHSPDDVLSMEVLRFDTKEALEGQLNGTPLSVAFSFGKAAEQAGESQSASKGGSVVQFNDALTAGGTEGAKKYTFIGLGGGEVVIYVTPSAPDQDLAVVIMDSQNRTLAESNEAPAGKAERLSFSIPDNAKLDVYKIFVLGNTAGEYKGIFIGSTRIFFTLRTMYLIAGSVPEGKAVGYAYSGKAGEPLTIAATPDTKSPIDVRIRIYRITDLNTPLGEANDNPLGAPEKLTFSVPEDGVYIVTVSDAGGGSGGFLMAISNR